MPTNTPTRSNQQRIGRGTRSAVTALTLAIALTGCAPPAQPNASATAARDPRTSQLASLWSQFREAVDIPTQPLTVDLGLQAPAGFTQADVDILARRAVTILRRSTAPQISDMNPDDAVDYVYAQQPTPTRFDFERDAIKTTQGRPWQAMATSRFPKTPSKARVIRVAANAKRYEGKLNDGTPAPYLAVTVEAHLVQQVPVAGEEFGSETTVPIVSYRAVSASSFRPRGGPSFWPAVRARMTPFGNDGCALIEDSTLLVPLTDPEVLREDLANLKTTLSNRSVSDTFNFSADNLSAQAKRNLRSEADKYRAERCEDSSGGQ